MSFGRNTFSPLLASVVAAVALGAAGGAPAQARTSQSAYNAAFDACEAGLAEAIGVSQSALAFRRAAIRTHPAYVRVTYVIRLGSDRSERLDAVCAWRVRGETLDIAFESEAARARFASRASETEDLAAADREFVSDGG